jgi:hypothetical protein
MAHHPEGYDGDHQPDTATLNRMRNARQRGSMMARAWGRSREPETPPDIPGGGSSTLRPSSRPTGRPPFGEKLDLWRKPMPKPRKRVRVSRTASREVACPFCGAKPGAPCIGARDKPRVSSYLERAQIAEKQKKRRWWR